MTAVIVGGGVMGEAILGGALEKDVLRPGEVIVVEVVEARRDHLVSRYGVNVAVAADDVLPEATLVLLAVKPQEFAHLSGKLAPGAVLMSIMAGVSIAALSSHFSHDRVIRVMPNTPAAVNAGMSVWTATRTVDEDQRAAARALLGAIGHELYVDDEAKLDMATALSGSGPAYVFLFIEALVEAGVAIGLTRAEAEELTLQTIYGSSLYARESEHSAADLRARVTSPAGTTAAGLLELERAGFRAAVAECVRAAYERSRELGGSR